MTKPSTFDSDFHHYVPKFFLKEFAFRSKKKALYIHIYDNITNRAIQPNIANIMGERAFNAYLAGEVAVSAEGVTANFDRIAAPSLKKVLESKTLSSLGKHERAAIILFVALQINRGTGARNRSEDLWRQLDRLLVSRFGQENVPSNLIPSESEDEKKQFHINFAMDSIKDIALLLSEKDWILMEALKEQSLYLAIIQFLCITPGRQTHFMGISGYLRRA